MIVDSSAIVAILLDEPERAAFEPLIKTAPMAAMAAPNHLESAMVLVSRRGPSIAVQLDALLVEMNIDILPFSHAHALAARDAFMRYGKGRHAAGLNFGECIAYAVAKVEDHPLLFKGGDFHLTDVEAALAR